MNSESVRLSSGSYRLIDHQRNALKKELGDDCEVPSYVLGSLVMLVNVKVMTYLGMNAPYAEAELNEVRPIAKEYFKDRFQEVCSAPRSEREGLLQRHLYNMRLAGLDQTVASDRDIELAVRGKKLRGVTDINAIVRSLVRTIVDC